MNEDSWPPTRRQVLAGLGVLGTTAAIPGSSWGRTDGRQPSAAEAARALVPGDAVTHEATDTGDWSDPGIWDGDEVPGDDANVQIASGATVTLDGRREERLRTVRVDGTLRVDPAVETGLDVETIVVVRGGTLELGTASEPATDCTITFVDRGPIEGPPEGAPIARGLLGLGTVRAHGVERSTFLPTATAGTGSADDTTASGGNRPAGPTEGATSIELGSAPTGWNPGDRIVIAGIAPDRNEDEERTAASVESSTVHFDEPLVYDHVPPEPDLAVHVANLERSVRLRSENTDIRRRGHVAFTSSDVELAYVGTYDLGRTDKSRSITDPHNGTPPRDVERNPKARYAIHFHRTGTSEAAGTARLEGCLVWGSPGWGIVNHGSRVVAEDCVTYDVLGSGFVGERGDEQGAFRNNFALRSAGSGFGVDTRQFRGHQGLHGSGHPERADIDDFGHGGHGFWFQGPGITVEDNVAAGHRHHAYVYWTRGLPDETVHPDEIGGTRGVRPNYPVEYLTNQPTLANSDRVENGRVPSSYVSIRSFAGNTAYASAGGMEISRHQNGGDHARSEEYSVIEGFTVHSIGPFVNRWDSIREDDGRLALKLKYSANVLLQSCRFLGTDKRGVGIRRNQGLTGLPMEDCEIRDWEIGVRLPEDGPVPIRNCTFDNATDLEIRGGYTQHWTLPFTVRIEDTALLGETGTPIDFAYDLDEERYGVFDHRTWLSLDGRTVYAPEQEPSFVPFPDDDALDASEYSDRLHELASVESLDHDELVGRSNADLERSVGLAVGGAPTPADATTDDRVPGCRVASAPPVERFVDAGTAQPGAGFQAVEGSGQGALHAVDESTEYPPSSGIATYEVELPEGRYALWMRVIAPDGESDSLWFHVDDREWVRWNRIEDGRSWTWDRAHDTDDDHTPVVLDLGAGTHEIAVAYRESDLQLDALYLTNSDRRPFGPPPEA